jgi:hypothetical protein
MAHAESSELLQALTANVRLANPELMIGCARRRSIHPFSVAQLHPLRLPTPKKTPG